MKIERLGIQAATVGTTAGGMAVLLSMLIICAGFAEPQALGALLAIGVGATVLGQGLSLAVPRASGARGCFSGALLCTTIGTAMALSSHASTSPNLLGAMVVMVGFGFTLVGLSRLASWAERPSLVRHIDTVVRLGTCGILLLLSRPLGITLIPPGMGVFAMLAALALYARTAWKTGAALR